MKKKKLLIYLVVISTAINLNAQYTLEQCELYYNQGQYSVIIPTLKNFKGRVYKQNSFLINYMLGTSLCRTQSVENGTKLLHWLKRKYDLDYQQKIIINNEINRCGIDQVMPSSIAWIGIGRNSIAGIRSKVYKRRFNIDSSFSYSQNKLIDSSYFGIYSKRIIKKDSIQNINIPKLFYTDANNLNKHIVSDNFIVFSGNNKTEQALKHIANQLERTLKFYFEFYDFKNPNSYINVNVLNSFNSLYDFAGNFHKIKVSQRTIGYTFEPDHSISGFLPFTGTGTLRHELLHLLLHQNFQAVPPWMDEGLSSLYEVSRFDDTDSLYGKDNWRGRLISKYWNHVTRKPSFQLKFILTKFDWEMANKNYEYFEIIYAVSRYFFLFLQEEGKLKIYFNKVINYSPNSEEDFFIQELEKVFTDSYENIEKEFYKWLEKIIKP